MSEKAVTPSVSWRLEAWFNDISPERYAKLKDFNAMLHKNNRALNLVSSKTLPLSDVLHFSDSILAMRLLFDDNKNIDHLYDLASGSGFPGLIGAVLFPKTKFSLVEVDAKKCEFLKACVDELKLSNVSVINSTIESLPANSVKYSVTRGFGNISKMILVARKCVPTGGTLYHMRGEQWGLEVSQIPTQLCSVWTPSLIKEYKLPIGEIRFALLKTDKN